MKAMVLILLFHSSGELFAKCPVDDYPGIAVEGVLDSSRYFVLKIVDETGMGTYKRVCIHVVHKCVCLIITIRKQS